MAKVTAQYAYDFDKFNMNWYYRNEGSELRRNAQDNEPGEKTYSIFTEDNAWAIHGTVLRYNKAGDVVRGTVLGMSEWFWDDTELEWVQIYMLEGLDLTAREVFDVAQTFKKSDDHALLEAELSGNDVFRLSSYDDNAYGFGGADRMYGYGGRDTLRGGDGNDKLFGGNQGDLLEGGDGRDRLRGDSGNDKLKGGGDNDILRGGEGRDQVWGGKGEDLFVFKDGDGTDIIRDFETARQAHDRIDLSGLSSVNGWIDLKNNHMTQDGNDVVIDGGEGDVMILRNVDLGDLMKAYFDF